MCCSSAAHTLDAHRIMHAFLALVIALAAPALYAPAPARFGYDREIQSAGFNLVPEVQNPYVLNMDYLTSQKNRSKLITKPKPEDFVVDDNVILESNVLSIVRPLVRQRRGYNLENVRVPARYPYLPVPNYNRFRRWG